MSATDVCEAVGMDVDLDKPVACQGKDCQHEAVWHGRRPCCNASTLACDECHDRLEANDARMLRTPAWTVCALCRAALRHIVWTRL